MGSNEDKTRLSVLCWRITSVEFLRALQYGYGLICHAANGLCLFSRGSHQASAIHFLRATVGWRPDGGDNSDTQGDWSCSSASSRSLQGTPHRITKSRDLSQSPWLS